MSQRAHMDAIVAYLAKHGPSKIAFITQGLPGTPVNRDLLRKLCATGRIEKTGVREFRIKEPAS
jgi:hypothetical protein